jgi:hypothetical protein
MPSRSSLKPISSSPSSLRPVPVVVHPRDTKVSNMPDSSNLLWLGEVAVRHSRLSQDADDIIRLACSYTKCEVVWNTEKGLHFAIFEREDGNGQDVMPVSTVNDYIMQSRAEIRQRMIDHIISEIRQDGYSLHGSRSSYAMGCRGLLCRRAHREGMRSHQGTKRSPKYAVADELLNEVETAFERQGASLAPFLADKVAAS